MKRIISLIIMTFFLYGCQSLRTDLKLDRHVASHPVKIAYEEDADKYMVHVFAGHEWSKETNSHYIEVEGYIKDPNAPKSILHAFGILKQKPSEKDLSKAMVEVTFLNKEGKIISTKEVPVNFKRVNHMSHRHDSKFTAQEDDNPEIVLCKLKITWG